MFIKTDSDGYITMAMSSFFEGSLEVQDENVLLENFDFLNCIKYVDGEVLIDEDKKAQSLIEFEARQADENTKIYIDELRHERETECFSVINQIYIIDGVAKSWFDTLTVEQQEDAAVWVQSWRDVTDTLIKPTKPLWLE